MFVGDGDLAGKDWAIVRIGRKFIAFIVQSRVCPQVLREAWEAFAGFRGFDEGIPAPRWATAPHAWTMALA